MTSINEYVIDAHSLIWYIALSPRLGPNARRVMDDAGSRLYLPVIALLEACWVVEAGKTVIPAVKALLSDVDADPRIVTVPLDRSILDVSLTIPTVPEMHDRLIVATALHLSTGGSPVCVLTRDSAIAAFGLVSVVW